MPLLSSHMPSTKGTAWSRDGLAHFLDSWVDLRSSGVLPALLGHGGAWTARYCFTVWAFAGTCWHNDYTFAIADWPSI